MKPLSFDVWFVTCEQMKPSWNPKSSVICFWQQEASPLVASALCLATRPGYEFLLFILLLSPEACFIPLISASWFCQKLRGSGSLKPGFSFCALFGGWASCFPTVPDVFMYFVLFCIFSTTVQRWLWGSYALELWIFAATSARVWAFGPVWKCFRWVQICMKRQAWLWGHKNIVLNFWNHTTSPKYYRRL